MTKFLENISREPGQLAVAELLRRDFHSLQEEPIG